MAMYCFTSWKQKRTRTTNSRRPTLRAWFLLILLRTQEILMTNMRRLLLCFWQILEKCPLWTASATFVLLALFQKVAPFCLTALPSLARRPSSPASTATTSTTSSTPRRRA
eukprot:7329486-Pyramimonas_sp.AAC.1